jgi:hypothetical protein
MSLKAMGMPVSAPASPACRRWSARRAWASANSRVRSGRMNAFSSPLSLAMRSRNWLVSSTEEVFFADSADASSVSE